MTRPLPPIPRRDALAFLLLAAGLAQAAADPLRHQATVTVTRPGLHVALPLPADLHARVRHPDLRDLRLVDADGRRVPFAQMPPAPPAPPAGQTRAAPLYPLPPDPAGPPATAPVTLDLRLDGDRLHLRREGREVAPAGADRPAPGWVIDLGERLARDAGPATVELLWPDDAEVDTVARLHASPDLRHWEPAGQVALMALHGAGGAPLRQARLPIAGPVPRYLMLRWADPARAPRLTGARVSTPGSAPGPEPGDRVTAPARAAGNGALEFDLGAALPLRHIDLVLPPGNRLVPVQWLGRHDRGRPWQPLARQVHQRLERSGTVIRSAPVRLDGRWRQLRAEPDPRAGPLDPAGLMLEAEVVPTWLVFVPQGRAPYTLQAGAPSAQAAEAADGPMPLATLVADLEAERPRLGLAAIGPWREDAEAARTEARSQAQAALRPWLLWGVLVAGVAGLGAMVWRLGRPGPA